MVNRFLRVHLIWNEMGLKIQVRCRDGFPGIGIDKVYLKAVYKNSKQNLVDLKQNLHLLVKHIQNHGAKVITNVLLYFLTLNAI